MANRFPLIVDTTGTSAIKELASGDNLDLTGSGVVGAGTVALTNLTVGGSQGSDGQVLTSTGSGVAWENAGQSAAEIRTLVNSATDSNVFTDADHSKLDGIEASADVTDATNVTAAGALMDSEVTNLAQVKAFASSDYATSAQGTTADAALPKTGGAMTGAITTNSTFDGRDVATDGTKLDGIEASADVTDAANVTAAGALMDSELTSVASVKAMNQGVATTDSPTFAGITTSGITNTANLKISGAQGTDGQILTSTGSGVAWEDAAGGGGAWTVISSTTVSSAVASVEFTLAGYENYALKFTNLNTSGNSNYSTLRLQFSVDGGSNYLSTVYATRRHMGTYDSTSTSYHGRDNQVSDSFLGVTDVYQGTNSNTDGMVFIYNNKAGVNNKTGIFHAIDSRGYNNANNHNPFYADGAYVVTDSSVINKVKWLLAGGNSYNISHGTYTLYGIANS